MIDVLLVLIIHLHGDHAPHAESLDALVPQPPPPNQKPNQSDQRTVVIVIDKDHHYQINSEDTDEKQDGAAPGGDFQDARRAGRVRQGR